MKIDDNVIEKWPEFSGMEKPVILVHEEIETNDNAILLTECPLSNIVIGIILAGEWVPSSGTHNVIIGIVEQIFSSQEESIDNSGIRYPRVLGFLGGPQGFARGHYIELTRENVSKYLNQGGADMLGFGSLRAMNFEDYIEISNLSKALNVFRFFIL